MTDEGKPREKLLEEIAELRYRVRVLSQLGAAINIVGPDDGTILHANAQFEAMLGYEPGELAGNHISVVNAPGEKTRAETADEIMRCLNDAGHWSGEVKNIRKDGGIVWCHATVVMVDHPKYGKAWASVHEDITERKRAEAALRESEEKYRAVVENANDGIVIVQGQEVRFANDRIARMLGYEVDELISSDFSKLILPENAPEIMDRYGERLAGEAGASSYEITVPKKNGEKVPVEASSAVIRYEGKPAIVAVVRDITDRKRMEKLLRIGRDLAVALNAAPGLDEGLRVCLDAALEASGMDCGGVYTVDQTAGAVDLVHHVGLSFRFVSGASHFDAGSANAQLVMAGEPIYTQHLKVDVPLTEDERRESLRAIAIIPVRHEDSVVACLIVASHELDEVPLNSREALETIAAQIGSAIARMRAEDALRESEERYRQLVELSPDCIAIHKEGRIAFINAAGARYLGAGSPGELVGRPIMDFLQCDYRPEVEERLARLGREEGPVPYTAETLVRLDGGHLDVEVSAVRYTRQGQPAVLAIARDITDRKRAEEQRSLALGVLKLLNESSERRDCIRDILSLIKDATGSEAVGIRLAEGDDFPYYEINGFSDEFVEAEKHLCEYDESGRLVRDADGDPCLDCMCGNVIRGRIDTSKPFFTKGGSFWTNSTTELLASTTEEDRLARTRNRCNGEGYESVALVPLRAGAETIGLLQLNDRQENMLTLEQIVFLEGLGASIGIALTRKQAEQRLRAYQGRLRSLASELALAEERERRRIAAGLHDHVTQDLIAVKSRLDNCSRRKTGPDCAECVDRAQALIQNSISELRDMTFELGSPILYELGLAVALDETVKEFQEKHGIRSEFEDDGKAKPLGPDLGALVFRAVRELLVNVVKHAKADRLTVSTTRDDEGLKVVVEDDGIGFEVAEAASAAGKAMKFGLFGIRERLEYVGGELRLESEPGRGARITLVVPLKDEQETDPERSK